jgi:ribosomal-protein-serine acetyltransferase
MGLTPVVDSAPSLVREQVMREQVILCDGFIHIRRFRPEDGPLLFAAARESVGELCAGMTWCHPGYSLEDSRAFVLRCHSQWERGEHYSFAICDAEAASFLGSVGLSHLNPTHKFANVGYWVRTSHTGKGIASAATRLIARFAFRELGLHRLEIVVATDNPASQRVAEKARAKREGILRHRLVLGGRRRDAILYSLIPGDLTA